MSERPYTDYYEVLQLSPRATAETVERVYRLLAKRYHPDNQDTGDATIFSQIHEAYNVISNSERRAAFDVQYDGMQNVRWKIFDQQSATDQREMDRRVIHGVLSLLYVERRRDPSRGGLGALFLERTLGVPEEHLHFPMWYMKQHGWVEVLDTGQFAITVEGIDHLHEMDMGPREDRLLPASSAEGDAPRALADRSGVLR